MHRLLEELLNSGNTPEVVCRDCPELLPEVRQRWQEFQLVDEQIRALLPGVGTFPTVYSTAPPQPSLVLPAAFGRYQLRSRLGVGGFGVVYLGHDTELDRHVAIKLLHAQARPIEVQHNFALQEARRLAQLRHPGIVAVHDVGVHQGQLFIVSDYIEGSDLGQWLGVRRPTWSDAAAIAAAVADALAHAHARLIVHRDIKPANILLNSDTTPVLVDFGLALDESQDSSSSRGVVAGTPSYMSPEQASGAAHRIDGRTDIYSLGVVLYEMLTGQLPFRARNTYELLRQVRDDEPQPPRQLIDDIPPELERVCLKALAKRQHDRQTSAADFAAELRRILSNSIQEDQATLRLHWNTSPPLPGLKRRTVGRQKELQEMERAFVEAASGQGCVLCVTGEPGIGKTTLIDDFLSELSATNYPYALARGRCSERLAGTEAYLPFLEALESLLHGEYAETAAQLMKSAAPNWYEQVASTAANELPLEQRIAESRAASQQRLKRELATCLREMARQRPLLIFIDDLHWADPSTVDLLAYLAGKCDAMSILFVLTYRPTDLALTKHLFGPVKLDLQARGVCRELALEFLPRSDLDQYLSLEFPNHDFPNEFADMVHARTEGSPLFMVDLLRYLRDRQVLAQEQERWILRQSVPDLRRELPESVRGMIQRKIDQLGGDDRRLLVAASVQGYEFDSAVVAKVLGRDPAEVEDRLGELNRVHAFVRRVGELEFPDRTLTVQYCFVHVLYQNVLYDSLQPTRRASLNGAVAQALCAYYGDNSVELAGVLAMLLKEARDIKGAAKYFLIAAQNAARVYANHETVILARRGIEVLSALPDTPERAHQELALQITLGSALFATNDWTASEVELAYTRAQELCRELGESSELFPALWGLFLFHIARGEIWTGIEQGAHLLNLAQRIRDPGLLLQAHHALGPTYGLVGNWEAAQTHLEQAIAGYDRQIHHKQAFFYGGHDPCVCCLSYSAKARWMLGYPEQALQLGQQAIALASDLGHPTSLAHTQLSVAMVHQYLRNASETLALAEALQKLAADQGLPYYLAGGLVLQGWAIAELGHGEEGIALIQKGFATGGSTRAHWRSYSLTLLADAHGKCQNLTEGLVALEDAMTVVAATGICIFEPEIYRLKGEFLLSQDIQKSAEAEACYGEAIAIARRQQAKTLELRATLSLARFYERQGRFADGQAALSTIYGTFTEGFGTPDLVDAAAHLKRLSRTSSRDAASW
ncbi:serine/threonine-protein kinase [Aureliella helgolandensis]|uniref:Serine/threonine-protein kinase PrkC n=1 Tax=Aureliella helgolandensis TaxID=2527968 RepID=A0A518G6J8_9BACT|nr:serine/threonine-protein kinase [Aureliella helgolandensis]QDV24218.1 Serine/threonine-protein kinase PrkC [Aureliella helgolandensis]